jgi:hypothetical protein
MKLQKGLTSFLICLLFVTARPERIGAQTSEQDQVRITEMRRLEAEQYRLTVAAPDPGIYLLEFSTNFHDWSSILRTNINASGLLAFTLVSTQQAGFFRVGNP